ncbi:MAG: hypothetical protein M5R40_14600 [Anaerolineae bacterium]|nr:hypothetical protein [Anaerolineae bacterium]
MSEEHPKRESSSRRLLSGRAENPARDSEGAPEEPDDSTPRSPLHPTPPEAPEPPQRLVPNPPPLRPRAPRGRRPRAPAPHPTTLNARPCRKRPPMLQRRNAPPRLSATRSSGR